MTENEKLYTIKEAAKLKNIHYVTLLKAVRTGVVPCYRLVNTKRYVKMSDIDAVMRAAAAANASEVA